MDRKQKSKYLILIWMNDPFEDKQMISFCLDADILKEKLTNRKHRKHKKITL